MTDIDGFLRASIARKVYVVEGAWRDVKDKLWGDGKQFFVSTYENVPLLMFPAVHQFGIVVGRTLKLFPLERFYGAEIEGELMKDLLDASLTSYVDTKNMLEASKRLQTENPPSRSTKQSRAQAFENWMREGNLL